MQKARGRNNTSALFGVHQIPSTQQICNLLNPISPDRLAPVFVDVVESLHRHGALEGYRGAGDRVLIALDGTEYHCSASIHCPQCSTRTSTNGKTQYYYPAALIPVILAPDQAAVFPLPLEFVRPQDGQAKQDCARNAGTRWLHRWARSISVWRTTVLGDDLTAIRPFASNDLLLRDGDDALLVGWCELATTDAVGNGLCRNAWASSEPVTEAKVAAGRSRWKIKNENNPMFKTKGDNCEHNDGHGKQHLAALLASLILLAFLAHTVLDLLDRRYPAVRQHLSSHRTFCEHLRALTQYLPFESWDQLFDFMLAALQSAQPPPARRSGAKQGQI